MTEANRVLMVGLLPEVVDFSKWPDLTAERIVEGLETARRDLEQQGFPTRICLVDRGETAAEVLRTELEAQTYACVLVGAGVRMDADLTPLFEVVVNTVRKHAPSANLAFNTSPFDSAEAVRRWLS